MALKNIGKITLLLSQGRCQYIQGRIDERIFEAVKKRKRIRLQEVGIRSGRKSNPKSKNVSVFKNNSSGGKLLFWFMSAILRSGNGDRQILFFLNQLAGNY